MLCLVDEAIKKITRSTSDKIKRYPVQYTLFRIIKYRTYIHTWSGDWRTILHIEITARSIAQNWMSSRGRKRNDERTRKNWETEMKKK